MKNKIVKQSLSTIVLTFLFTAAILTLGYISFGIWVALIFTSGFLGGFIIWIFTPNGASFTDIKTPYWLTFLAFLIHRVEEKYCGFFTRLSEITGVPVPEITSLPIVLLVLTSVGAWLIIPMLVKRGHPIGYYLSWTFFAAMGITELAHFIFPFFTNQPYGYFPGMASVFFLAPLSWWGMIRLLRRNTNGIEP